MKTHLKRAYLAAGVAATMAAPAAMSQETGGASLDVTAVTDHLDGPVQLAITGIGTSILVLAVAAMGFKWIKGMIFS